MEEPLNLLEEFDRALILEDYMALLADQKPLHELHYKKAQISDFQIDSLPALKLLVITEPWCGDSTAILPVLMKFFEKHPAEIRVALRDQNTDLMDKFLTNGGRAIPIVIVMNEAGSYLTHFGPRPEEAKAIFESYREEINAGRLERREVSKKIRTFYAKDRGNAILKGFTGQLTEALNKN